MAKTPQEVTNEVTAALEKLGPEPTPAQMSALLAKLRTFSDTVNGIEMNLYVKGDIAGDAHIHLRDQLQAWYDLLEYYEKTAAAATSPESIFKTVTSPLLYGICYSEPSCSQVLADQWAPSGFPITPRIQEPFIILSATGSAQEATLQNTFVKAVKDSVDEYVEKAKEKVSSLLPSFDDFSSMPAWAWALVGVLGLATVIALLREP